MKVIFVDCDGVLNKASDFETYMDGTDNYFRLNRKLVDRLLKIVKDTDAKLVLSTSWRKLHGSIEFLNKCGLEFIDQTVNFSDKGSKRGFEIQDWLDAHPEVTVYAILDDDSDMLLSQRENFFQTEFEYGLSEGIAYRVTYKLNNGK